MLKTLNEIAEGNEGPKTFKRLKDQYKKSNERVKVAVAELLKVRDKLGGGPVARAIDDVVNKNGFGKDAGEGARGQRSWLETIGFTEAMSQ